MKNDDAYRILLSGYETCSVESAISPQFETVTIGGETYHLYNAPYYTLDGDPGTKSLCLLLDPTVFTDDIDPATAFKLTFYDGGETGSDRFPTMEKTFSDAVVISASGKGDRRAFVLDDSVMTVSTWDMAFNGTLSVYYENRYILTLYARTLVKPSGSTAQTVVTYDHPLDFYAGLWSTRSSGGSSSNVFGPCVSDVFYSCTGGRFTRSDCANSKSASGFKSEYKLFNKPASSTRVEIDKDLYEYDFEYKNYDGVMYSNPVVVDKRVIGHVTDYSYSGGSDYKGTPASFESDDEIHSGNPVLTGTGDINVIDGIGYPFDGAIALYPYREPPKRTLLSGTPPDLYLYGDCLSTHKCREQTGMTQKRWGVIIRICEGLYKDGPHVQTRYELIETEYPNGSWPAPGSVAYKWIKFGDCTLYIPYAADSSGKYVEDKAGNGALVGYASDAWVCEANAIPAPGSLDWDPASCPPEDDDCFKYFIVVEEREFKNTTNCNSPLKVEKIHYSAMDVTKEVYSGAFDKEKIEFELDEPFKIGKTRQICYNCQGELTDGNELWTVAGVGVYKKRVFGPIMFPSVDENEVTAEEAISDYVAANFTDVDPSAAGTECDGECYKYVTAMGAEMVSISLGSKKVTGTDVDTVIIGQIVVDQLYSGWTWKITSVHNNGQWSLSLPPQEGSNVVLSSGALHGICNHWEFVEEQGTNVMDNAVMPYCIRVSEDQLDGDYDEVILQLTPPC